MNYPHREHEPRSNRGPLYMVRPDGTHERLTRRGDRGSQMLGMLIVAFPIGLLLFIVGVQYGKLHPALPAAPVGAAQHIPGSVAP